MVDFKTAHIRRQVVATFRSGSYHKAAALARKALTQNKNDSETQQILALSLMHLGRHHEAIAIFEKILIKRQDDPAILTDMANAYLWKGDFALARKYFDLVLAQKPGFVHAISGKGQALDREGNYDAVEDLLGPIVRAGQEWPVMAVTYSRMLQHKGEYEASAALAAKHLANPQIDDKTRYFLCEMAAKSYEKLEQYDKAFAAFSESNRLKSRPFNAQEYVERIDDLLAVFSRDNLAKLPRSRMRSDLPVFIASMPRSGSTLVEQIIHAHGKAFGAGEINEMQELVAGLPARLESMQPYPACLGDFKQHHADEMARSYLEDLRSYDPKALRITNKHLLNYMQLGMIELLLPGARVVHVKRDPLDNCFSMFMAQLATDVFPWASDLHSLGLAYKQYERIMAHWHDVLKIPILDVQYEDLVDDTETWIRRIIEFCGLPWDDKCLRYWEADRSVMTLSYDQVRKPIYKSAVKRYEKYEQYLGPLKAALAGEGA